MSAEYIIEMSNLTGVPIDEMITMYPDLVEQYKLYVTIETTRIFLILFSITFLGLYLVFLIGSKGFSIETKVKEEIDQICKIRRNNSFIILGMLLMCVVATVATFYLPTYVAPDFSLLVRVFS